MNDENLLAAAKEFATSISNTVSTFTSESHPFVASIAGARVTIRRDRSSGGGLHQIGLKAGGQIILSLVVEFDCTWDSSGDYLRVEKSRFVVYPLARIDREPLFRYDFEREPTGSIPGAHLQVHAHRDSFTHLLGFGGRGSKRARNREKKKFERTPSVSQFHFPLGGKRYRPCLEDILDALRDEFGLDSGPDWTKVRDDARAE